VLSQFLGQEWQAGGQVALLLAPVDLRQQIGGQDLRFFQGLPDWPALAQVGPELCPNCGKRTARTRAWVATRPVLLWDR